MGEWRDRPEFSAEIILCYKDKCIFNFSILLNC